MVSAHVWRLHCNRRRRRRRRFELLLRSCDLWQSEYLFIIDIWRSLLCLFLIRVSTRAVAVRHTCGRDGHHARDGHRHTHSHSHVFVMCRQPHAVFIYHVYCIINIENTRATSSVRIIIFFYCASHYAHQRMRVYDSIIIMRVRACARECVQVCARVPISSCCLTHNHFTVIRGELLLLLCGSLFQIDKHRWPQQRRLLASPRRRRAVDAGAAAQVH